MCLRVRMLKCQRALRALHTHVLTCQCAFHAHLPACLECSHAFRTYVLICQRALSPLPHMACVTMCSHLACIASSFDATFFSFIAIVVEVLDTVHKV